MFPLETKGTISNKYYLARYDSFGTIFLKFFLRILFLVFVEQIMKLNVERCSIRMRLYFFNFNKSGRKSWPMNLFIRLLSNYINLFLMVEGLLIFLSPF